MVYGWVTSSIQIVFTHNHSLAGGTCDIIVYKAGNFWVSIVLIVSPAKYIFYIHVVFS